MAPVFGATQAIPCGPMATPSRSSMTTMDKPKQRVNAATIGATAAAISARKRRRKVDLHAQRRLVASEFAAGRIIARDPDAVEGRPEFDDRHRVPPRHDKDTPGELTWYGQPSAETSGGEARDMHLRVVEIHQRLWSQASLAPKLAVAGRIGLPAHVVALGRLPVRELHQSACRSTSGTTSRSHSGFARLTASLRREPSERNLAHFVVPVAFPPR